MRSDEFFARKCVLVTGASSGIGAALAEQLGLHGASVGLFARRQRELEDVAERVERAGGRACVLVGDTTDLDQVQQAHQQMQRAFGAVETAFLNAGAGASVPIHRFSAAQLRQMLEINVMGVANWLELILPTMLARGRGTVVGVSSLAANVGGPLAGSYSASKAALSNLFESLRAEAQLRGVGFCTVEPGFIRTPLTDKNKHPMPFLMEVDEAARRIIDGVAAGTKVIRFPWPMAAMVSLVRHLPAGLYDRLATRMIPSGGRGLKKEG